jgi:hypothetical protein
VIRITWATIMPVTVKSSLRWRARPHAGKEHIASSPQTTGGSPMSVRIR